MWFGIAMGFACGLVKGLYDMFLFIARILGSALALFVLLIMRDLLPLRSLFCTICDVSNLLVFVSPEIRLCIVTLCSAPVRHLISNYIISHATSSHL